MAVGEVRPGYELWRPNREKSESVTTKFIIVVLLLATAIIAGIVTVTGFSLLEGGIGMGIACFLYVALYVLFAFLVWRWNRGVLPVAAAFAILLLIFCAVGANSWFARDKAGFDEALIPVPLIGLLVVILIPLQVLLITIAMVGFNQEWDVEEERPIGSSADDGAGEPPDPRAPHPACRGPGAVAEVDLDPTSPFGQWILNPSRIQNSATPAAKRNDRG